MPTSSRQPIKRCLQALPSPFAVPTVIERYHPQVFLEGDKTPHPKSFLFSPDGPHWKSRRDGSLVISGDDMARTRSSSCLVSSMVRHALEIAVCTSSFARCSR